MDNYGVGARIDRLPISAVHRYWLLVVAIPLFFDTSDIFTFSYAAPVLIHFWGITLRQVALATSAGFGGMAIGGMLGGAISDRIGRKKGMIAFATLFSLFSLTNGFALNVPMLVATRFLTGLGISSATVTVITYIAEMYPTSVRGRWQSWGMVIGLSGIPVTSLVARLVVPTGPDGWRWIFIWGALGFPFLYLATTLPESPRWLAGRGRHDEAEAALAKIEAAVEKQHGALPAPQTPPQSVTLKLPWIALFSRVYVTRTLSLCGIWFFQTVGFYGFMSWVPTLLEQHGFAVVKSLTYTMLINAGALPGALTAVYFSERTERKYAVAVTALVVAVFGLCYGLTFQPVLIVTFGFLAGMAMYTFATFCFAYTPEQYPTDIRNSGSGLAYGFGRLANVVNPFVIAAIFSSSGYSWVFAYIAGAWIITALIAFAFGAKTTRRSLESISETDRG